MYLNEMSSEIYATLFDRIIMDKYPEDARLKEEELAKEFSVSRTPVREAFRQLAQDGLVEILPNRGTKVIGFTVDDVEEIYEIRKSLERQALRNSAPSLSIQGLKEIRIEIQKVGTTDDYKMHERVDSRFHNYFIEASGKRRLIAILTQMFRLIQRFRELGFKEACIRETAAKAHLEIVDALCIRNVALAEALLEKHIEESKINAISLLVKSG